jgi:hypothetical protein
MTHFSLLRAFALLLIVLPALGVHYVLLAKATGTLYVDPQITQVQPVGSSFSVTVKVATVDPFNAWDIQVQTDPTVISPTNIATADNVLNINFSIQTLELTNCVNGGAGFASGSPGNLGCSASDGPGIIHSAIFGLGPSPATSITGLLFTISYTVTGGAGFSSIQLINDVLSSGVSVVHITLGGSYGTTVKPDFTLDTNTTSYVGLQGSSGDFNITLTSVNGLSDSVGLTAQSDPNAPPTILTTSFKPNSVTLSANGYASSILSFRTSQAAAFYHVTVTALSASGVSHSKMLTVSALASPDFIISAAPSLLRIHATNSGSSIITLDTQSGFSGSIRLSMAVPPVPGLIASLGSTNLTISPGRPATTVFAVRTPPSDLPFVYLINITASSQSRTHDPFTIIVKSPSPDFTFQIGGSGFVVQAGQSLTFTLNMTSVDYFKGQLFLLATSLSGIKEVFTRPSVTLDFGNSSTSLMTMTTDPYLAPGNHNVNMTALGTTFLGVSVNHTITTTITVIPVSVAKTILGLQPLAYFGVVGLLWLGVIGATIREIRKPKPKRFLS